MLPDGLASGRPRTRSASLHGSRASSASRSSISPEEQQLADELQTAGARMESQGRSTSTSSSTDSEARDSLKDREANERSMEFIRRHCQVQANVSPPGSQANSSGKTSSNGPRRPGQQLTSARVLGLASAGSGDPGPSQLQGGSSTPSGTTSDKGAASSSSGSELLSILKKAGNLSMGELTDKIAKLEQTVLARDVAAAAMLQNCEDMEEAGTAALAKVMLELQAAVKAKDIAEKERNSAEAKAAGDKARYDYNMAYEMEENEKQAILQKRHEEDMLEIRKELNQAKNDREKADIDEAHAIASQAMSADRIEALEKALALSTAKLNAVYAIGGIARSKDEKERDLRAEIQQMEQEKQDTGKEMSRMRLELLGLQRDKDRRKVDEPQSGQMSSSSRQGRRGGKGTRKGTGHVLEIIDEEEDDLPEIRSLDNAEFEDWASECVSSDDGGDSTPDTTAQKDLVIKLLKQLQDQKKAMQDLKAEHAGTNAEQFEQIEQLMLRISENNQLNEKMAVEHAILKKLERSNRLDHIKKMDALQRTMRTMQGQLDDQDVVMQEQNRTAEASELNQTNLEEQLQLQNEALRITSLRLQDALQQHENDSIRHQQEQSSLKLQLAVERKKAGTYVPEESGEGEALSPEEILEQRLKDLQEERCALLGKLEFMDVQFQLQIEEMQREQANKLQEQQRFFADQLSQLRAGGSSQISNLISSGGEYGEWTPTSHSLPEREGSGGSSQAMASAISGAASSPQATSDCGGTDASGSVTQAFRRFGGLKGLIWSILCTLPNVAAIMCLAEGVVVQNMTQRAGILLGSNLIGKSFYTLVKEQNVMSLQRTIMATMPSTDAAEPPAEDLTRTLARHQLEAPNRGPIDLLISAVHLPSSGGERHILILLIEQPSERAANQQSVASSDICPSDSVSVGRRRPQLMRSEVQRTKLRASFFSTRQSQRDGLSSSNSSPRSSLR